MAESQYMAFNVLRPDQVEAGQQQLIEGRNKLSMFPMEQQAAQQKIQSGAQELDTGKIEQASKKIDYSIQSLQQVNNQQSYDAWRNQMHGIGLDTAGDPDVFDPNWKQQTLMGAVSMKDKLTAQMQAQALGARMRIAGIDVNAPTNLATPTATPPTNSPYINDAKDGNGKSTSGYVNDVLAKVNNGQDIRTALLNQESNSNPNSPPSVDGAVGPAQILPATFQKYAKPGENIHNPTDNKAVYNRIIDDYSQKFGNDPAKIATAYFSGEGNVRPSEAATAEDTSKPPVKKPSETTKDYSARVTAWRADPTNIANQSEARASGSVGVKNAETLNQAALEAHKTLDAIQTLRDATAKFNSGATAEAKTTIARWAKAAGYDLSPEDEAALDNKQVFAKVANDLIGQAAKAEGGASRLQAAFNAIKGSQPNVGLEPATLNVLFDKLEKKAKYPIEQQAKWANTIKSNPNAKFTDFNTQYVAGLGQDEQATNAPQASVPHALDKYMTGTN